MWVEAVRDDVAEPEPEVSSGRRARARGLHRSGQLEWVASGAPLEHRADRHVPSFVDHRQVDVGERPRGEERDIGGAHGIVPVIRLLVQERSESLTR